MVQVIKMSNKFLKFSLNLICDLTIMRVVIVVVGRAIIIIVIMIMVVVVLFFVDVLTRLVLI